MSRSKAGLILLLCICVFRTAALAESPNLSPVDSIRAEEVSYRTVEAELGTYERFVTMKAMEYYPQTKALRYEGSGAKFVEYKVKRNDMVKAGDVLAVFDAEIDEVALAGLQMQMEQARLDYESERLRRLDEIEALMLQLRQAAGQGERELLMLQISKAETMLEKYDYEHAVSVEELNERISEMLAEKENCVLTAPFDGMITSTHYLHAGDRVPNDVVLITIESREKLLLIVNNSQGDFRFGMDVEIHAGDSKDKNVLKGRVVSSDAHLPAAMRTGYAGIEIESWNGEAIVNPSISAAVCQLDNLVLVPRRAVIQDSGKYMVHKLEDGMIHRRYVNFVMQNSSHAWIVQGVDPGETIVVD